METTTFLETKIFPISPICETDQEKKEAIGLIHRVYLCQLKNSRNYTAFTKTKSEVRGGGKKPWRQKGTGRARAGSLRSPLFVGGGVIFGPKPRIVSKKINKKERQLAIWSAFSLKQNQMKIVDPTAWIQCTSMNELQTKKVTHFLKENNISGTLKTLFILEKPNKYLWFASRNLPNVEITTLSCMNLTQLLKANSILLSTTSFNLINTLYGK